jgi:hypothetical protein
VQQALPFGIEHENPQGRQGEGGALRAYLVLIGCATDRKTIAYEELSRQIKRGGPNLLASTDSAGKRSAGVSFAGGREIDGTSGARLYRCEPEQGTREQEPGVGLRFVCNPSAYRLATFRRKISSTNSANSRPQTPSSCTTVRIHPRWA